METLYFGGPILTIEGTTAEAVLVRDGIIRAVGSLPEVACAASPDVKRRNLEGACLLPGLVDAHSHLCSFAQSLRLCDLSQADCLDDIIDLLQQQSASCGWIVGYGYDHTRLREGRHPTREVLDRVNEDTPVLISHASGHMGAVNSKALELLGITRATPNPEGGVIGREADSKTPSGFLEENAFFAASAQIPPVTQGEMLGLLAQAERIYASYGITTAQEGLAKAAEMELLSSADLTLDVVAYADQKEHAQCWETYRLYRGGYRRHLKLGGYKIFLDGSPQGRTAWVSRPYLGGEEGYVGYPTLTDEQVAHFVEQAHREGAQLLAHCNGDRAAEQYLRACLHARHEGTPPRRDVMIHAQLLRRDQLAEVKACGMIPSFFVSHTYYWGDTHLQNLGWERASLISPAASAARAGIPFTLHLDTPVLPPDMLDCIWCATRRVTRKGVPLDQNEALSVSQALRALTLHGAYQYFEETSKGSIREGKRADLVILSAPLYDGMDLEEIKSIRVLETIKDGETIYRAHG